VTVTGVVSRRAAKVAFDADRPGAAAGTETAGRGRRFALGVVVRGRRGISCRDSAWRGVPACRAPAGRSAAPDVPAALVTPAAPGRLLVRRRLFRRLRPKCYRRPGGCGHLTRDPPMALFRRSWRRRHCSSCRRWAVVTGTVVPPAAEDVHRDRCAAGRRGGHGTVVFRQIEACCHLSACRRSGRLLRSFRSRPAARR